VDLFQSRQVARSQADQGAKREDSHDGTGSRRCGRKDETLDQELPHDTPRSRAQGAPHGHLTCPGQRAAQQQVGGVAARDQQQQRGSREQYHDERSDRRHQVVVQSDHIRLPVPHELRLLDGELRGDGIHLLPRGLQLDSVTESGYDREVMTPSLGAVECRLTHQAPGTDFRLRIVEAARHDAEDGPGTTVEDERAREDRAVGAELIPPERVAEEEEALIV
jgi:hypothetical protein